MRTTTIAAAAALLLAGCDGNGIEKWQGDLLSTGWDKAPNAVGRPASQVTAQTEPSCLKGITALKNQWLLYLDPLIQANNRQLKALAAAMQEALLQSEEERPEETALARVMSAERHAEADKLQEDRDALTTLRDSMWSRCLLIEYTPPPFDGVWASLVGQEQ